jgi:hypothetical protein
MQKCTLARAGRANNGHNLPFRNRDINSFKDIQLAVAFGDVGGAKHWVWISDFKFRISDFSNEFRIPG